MLVSVALPIYNGLPYLRDAIASVLAQNIELEVVVSDDGSRDASEALVRDLSDPRIRVLTNDQNAGIFGNLNRCIAAARGEFIQVFSQDDLMKPGYLAAQVLALQNHTEAGLVYGTPDYIDENGVLIASHLRDDTPEVVDLRMYVWIASHYGALPPSISSVMIPRRTFDAIGLFNPYYRVAGDIEFYNRVAERFSIVCNKQVLHSVRSHRRMASALSSSGPLYLREEYALKDWYRSRWNEQDYRKIQRFRAATRGCLHLAWIGRALLNRQFRVTVDAIRQLGEVYPLGWVALWSVVHLVRPRWVARPSVPAPRR